MRASLFAAAITILTINVGQAEPYNIKAHKWLHHRSTQNGEITACQMEFRTIGITTSGRQLGVSGTIQTAFYRGRVPSLALKVHVLEVGNDEATPLKVTHANLTAGKLGMPDARPVPSDTPGAWLATTNARENPDAVAMLPIKAVTPPMGRISFATPSTEFDYNFQLPRPKNERESQQVSEFMSCITQGANAAKDRM